MLCNNVTSISFGLINCQTERPFFWDSKYSLSRSEHEEAGGGLPVTSVGSSGHRSRGQDASDGADPGAPAAPLAEPRVIPGPDQVHPAPVVRLLVEEPVAVGDVAGEDAVDVEAVHDAGAVVLQVHHLTPELDALVQAHAERTGLLLSNERTVRKAFGKQKQCVCMWTNH